MQTKASDYDEGLSNLMNKMKLHASETSAEVPPVVATKSQTEDRVTPDDSDDEDTMQGVSCEYDLNVGPVESVKEVKRSQLKDSVMTVDSWGGNEGLIPPFPANYVEEVAEHVDFGKLMNPTYFEYDVGGMPRAKVRRNKSSDEWSLDGSGHTKVSLLEERSRKSSYRGPKPIKDGVVLRGVLKRGNMSCDTSSSTLDTTISSSRREDEGRRSSRSSYDGGRPSTRQCSFSVVDIREHERIAGDNPCVTSGVPLGIGWGYIEHKPIELEYYESNKGQPRDKIEMLVPAEVRKKLLRDEFGVPMKDLNESIRSVNIAKRQRRSTVATQHLEAWTQVKESTKRKFGNILKKTSSAKEQEKLWEKAARSSSSLTMDAPLLDSRGGRREKALAYENDCHGKYGGNIPLQRW